MPFVPPPSAGTAPIRSAEAGRPDCFAFDKSPPVFAIANDSQSRYRAADCHSRTATSRAMPSDTTSLFIEHRGSLVDYATRIVGSRAQAEDLVQEAWLRFDEVARQRLLDEPLSYLYRIVRNLALDGRRSQVREARYLVRGADLQAENVAEDLPSPEAQAVGRA